ncbi:MAG: N-6 DNA methylase [Chloroflexi bacterium]|nr:N-6 DNA methylase [Chloroflexota bacterium]
MEPQVTERTFYPALIDLIRAQGGSGVSEVSYVSVPDIVFELLNRKWLLSVKIGEDVPTLKSAFIQYQRHKEESGLNHGLLLFLPTSVRATKPTAQDVMSAIHASPVTCLVDTPILKEEYRDLTFPQVLTRLLTEVGARLEQRLEKGYSLNFVISLLKQHVTDLMETVSLSDPMLLRVVTDRKLLTGISHLKAEQGESVGRFLASYIILSQILFFRLYSSATPELNELTEGLKPVNHYSLRQAFRRIRKINYRAIYEVDVLDSISEKYLLDTFDLIWGLEVERVRYELPGRIFHELMPANIRKMLAAFYTRPQAADILASLAIRWSNDSVFDPASGSGTILTAAYRRKKDLFIEEGKVGNPHRRFCQDEIYGADIMPFAVHLTSANLAAMDPATTLARTQIIQGDSLRLSSGRKYREGLQIEMFPLSPEAENNNGEKYKVDLEPVDVILMNPPFTKVERGIQQYVDMKRFHSLIGGEIGLWGHFIALADQFLNDGGIYGAVIPINILRGRESAKAREFIFANWTPLYILKSTFNYGFSEWSEYRDILLIAAKNPPTANKLVKFCLIKQGLKNLTKDDTSHIAQQVSSLGHLRSDKLDIESFQIEDLLQRSTNLMWFCGVSDFNHRDTLLAFLEKFSGCLRGFPDSYFREGYRPVPKGVSSFLFLTRNLEPCRTEEAFLSFTDDSDTSISAYSKLGVKYDIEKEVLSPTLRTGIGIRTLGIQDKWDYIVGRPYKAMNRVMRGSGFKPAGFGWEAFWRNLERELDMVRTNLVVARRINPYSPNTYLTAFFSESPFSPSNMVNVVVEPDTFKAKAIAVLLNSVLFLVQFFLLKEETTGRYIDIRFYDLYEMNLYPPDGKAFRNLVKVFEKYSQVQFPSLREQLDTNFDQRYKDFWSVRRRAQPSLFGVLGSPVAPSDIRLRFDLGICQALGVEVKPEELIEVYGTIVKEMILTRGLTRD